MKQPTDTMTISEAAESDLEPESAEVMRARDDDEALEALREILVDRYRKRLTVLQSDVDEVQSLLKLLEEQVNDKEALIATITPVMSDAISSSIRNSRDEMIEALYPIMGRLVSRAVTEAMRDLARSIDHQMRDTFGFANIKRRVQARVFGISDADLVIRTALPFRTEEIFLIHRESGLLLAHLSSGDDLDSDSDLISGMLTAIRSFVQDAFGRDTDGQLDTIQYGTMQILIESGRYTYLAAVVHGVEPAGYRTQLRDRLHQIEHEHFRTLRDYDGDASQLAGVAEPLTPLLLTITPVSVDAAQKNNEATRATSLNQVVLWIGFLAVMGLFAWRLWTIFGN